jgi:putative nucleotidyltransferase with HDIG domain
MSRDHAPDAGAGPTGLHARSQTLLDPDAERQLQESRGRTTQPLSARERWVEYPVAGAFIAATLALIIAFGGGRELSVGVALALLVAYVLAARVKFEVGPCYAVPTQLVFVPMLFALPVTAVPVVVALAILLSDAPSFLRRRRHPERAVIEIADCWHTLGPVLVLALAGGPEPALAEWPVFLLALGAQFAFDVAVNTPREWLELGVKPREQLESAGWTFGIDALLSPIGLLAAAMAAGDDYAFLLVLPLVALIAIFAGERRARLDAALELSEAYRGTTMALADVLDSDDEYTGSHSRMVVNLTRNVAERLGLDSDRRRLAEFAALLHDIGKIAIPSEVLNKPGPLSASEWALIKGHTVKGQEILERVGGFLGEVGQLVRASHERWDGGGYPDGLAGDAIPIESRIIACCDAFSAMVTDRPYRSAMPTEAAVAELRANSGSQFDPGVVTALVVLVEEWVAGSEPEGLGTMQASATAAAASQAPAFG